MGKTGGTATPRLPNSPSNLTGAIYIVNVEKKVANNMGRGGFSLPFNGD